jgi:phosphatidylserine decarboxylase
MKRGQEKGYFRFGGSTVILLTEPGKVAPDEDLLDATERGFETLVQVGTRIGLIADS